MPHQTALTVLATIAPGHLHTVQTLLSDMHEKGPGNNDLIPFAELSSVHFARLLVLGEVTDLDGATIPPHLCYMADVDSPADSHFDQLLAEHMSGVDAVFSHCIDYPQGTGDPNERRVWLRSHLISTAASYVHTVGRSVSQVRGEAHLREAIEEFLDGSEPVPATASAREAHSTVRAFVDGREDLRFALDRPARPETGFRLRELAHTVLLPALALIALLPLLLVVAVLLVVVRFKERRDVPETAVPTVAHIAKRERYEDFAAQNPFTAVGFVKPGKVRAIVMRGALLGLDYACRHVYRRDHLAGVRTLHFARWVPIDGGRRLVFASSYDGSLESYMDDFINRLAWGLNAVFSNGEGWPRTRWLVFGGARDEAAFKNYLRCHQVPTPVWYSAYDAQPAVNLDANSSMREHLPRDLDEKRAAEWLSRL